MNKTTRHIRAGSMPPTDCPPPAEDMEAEYRRFQRGVIKAYAIAVTLLVAAIAFFS